MEKSDLQSIAFQLISYAGTAFDHFYKSIDYAAEHDFEKAENEIRAGEAELSQAHRSQTALLTAEANQESMEFSIILIHAQDHLMTTIMFERVAKQFIKLYKEKS